jgi:hypothetical protein
MLNFKKTNLNKVLLVVAMAIVFFSAKNVLAASTFNYTLLESFPGFFTEGAVMTDLPKMILAIYKFGIWTIGIAGLLMITVGGIMYAGSAGNTATATKAKGIITDALIGIAAAMSAYLFLYVINPDLTNLKINFTPVSVDVATFGGSTGVGNPEPLSGDCRADAMLAKIKAASQGKMDPCLTFALLNTESRCTPNAQSGAGACGIAQLLPTTAGVSCATLKRNVDLSIQKGIAYFLSNQSKIRGNLSAGGISTSQAVEDLYAGYNGGAGALGASKTCTTGVNNFGFPYKIWDCPQNPGYRETRIASPRFLASYIACKNDATIQGKLK